MKRVLALCLVLSLLAATTHARKPPRNDEKGNAFFMVLILPDMDGDGINDSLIVRSDTRSSTRDFGWLRNRLVNCNTKYWTTFTVLSGGSGMSKAIVDTIGWCAEKLPDQTGFEIGGRFFLHDTMYRMFNGILFTPEQIREIVRMNPELGWTDGKAGKS